MNPYDEIMLRNLGLELSQFLGQPLDDVLERLDAEARRPGRLVADAWNLAKPRTVEEIKQFYQKTDAYLFDLAADHCRERRHAVWNVIDRRIERRGRGQRIVLYGDGIGTDSLFLAKKGHQVTYFDLPGITSAFAQFRFGRSFPKGQIQVITDEAEIRESAYSVVVSIEVLEHLSDPVAAMKRFHRSLALGGIALVTDSFGSIGPDYPSHLPSNSRFAGLTHRFMEEVGFASTFYNKCPINYPMEFTKVSNGIRGAATRLWYKTLRAAECRWRRFLGTQNKSTSSH